MRFIGILLVVAGLYFAVARPWFNTQISGDVIDETVLFQKGDGWRASSFDGEADENPVRVRINVYRLGGRINSGERLNLLLRVQNTNSVAIIYEQQLAFDLSNEPTTNLPDGGEQLHSLATESFDLPSDGTYKVGVAPVSASNPDRVDLRIHPNIVRVVAVTSEDVEAAGSGGGLFRGVMMIAGGILLISLAGRRRRKQQRDSAIHAEPAEQISREQRDDVPTRDEPAAKAEPAPKPKPKLKPEPETDVGKTIQWGRDAGKKK